LEPFDVWNGQDLEDMAVLIKVFVRFICAVDTFLFLATKISFSFTKKKLPRLNTSDFAAASTWQAVK